MNFFWTIFFFLSVISHCFKSQELDSVKKDLAKDNRYFRYNYDNDFFSQTDRYFTQGINPEVIAPFIRKLPLSKILIQLSKNSQRYYGLALQQDCFTPKSIRMDTLNRLERPFSGIFFLTHFLISIDPVKKQRLTTKLDLGVIGSCAKCEEEQKAIHKALLNIQPLGWENQINNALIINYSASIEQGLFLSRTFELAGFIDVRAGTLYDDLSGGFYFRYGLMNSYFKHLGIIKNSTNNKFQFYLNAKVKTRFVAYNATLQGAPFSSSIYVIEPERITRSVFIANCGLVLAYKRISFEFSKYYLTKEFFRGIDHGWGRCNITVCF